MNDAEIAELIHSSLPDLVAIYRFGSTADDTARPGSDVDLAILGTTPLDPVRRFDLQERVAARLRRDVDLVDLRRASTVMRMQVISTGRALASYDTTEQGAFEDHTFSAYARLNEERRQFLDQTAGKERALVDDVVLNKAAIIERCLARVREEYAGDERSLRNDSRRQESIILNLQRTCEATIDLAMHVVRRQRLGIPQETRDAFRLLAEAGTISADLAERLMRMVGFRNVAIHDYRRLDLDVVASIVTSRLGDFTELTAILLKQGG